MDLKVMIVQLEIKNNLFDEAVREINLNHVIDLIEKNVQDKPDLIVLPDEFLSGYGYGPLNLPVILENEVYPILGGLAKKIGCFIIGAAQDAITHTTSYSTGFLINPEGRVLGTQKRINIYPDELAFVKPGTEMKVIDTPFGKVGFLIGLDLLHPELASALVLDGVDLIFAPVYAFSDQNKVNEFTFDYPRILYKTAAQARAMENNVFLIFANGVGQHAFAEKPLCGNSMIIGPYGPILEMGSDEEIGKAVIALDMFKELYTEPLR